MTTKIKGRDESLSIDVLESLNIDVLVVLGLLSVFQNCYLSFLYCQVPDEFVV